MVARGCHPAHVRIWPIIVSLVLASSACTAGDPARSQPSTLGDGLRLTEPRAVHRATVLDDGKILITGGCTEPGCGGFDAGRTADLFDLDVGIVAGPQMATARASGTATLLEDGRVLLTGGYPGEGEEPTASAETYDPVTARFTPVAAMTRARADQTASLLSDGRVLIAGGFDESGRALAETEIFDPATDTFAPGPEMSAPRAAHVATVVGGEVVLIGGTVEAEALSTTDVLRDGSWVPGPELLTPRVKLGVAPLPEGRLLVVGGATDTEGHERLASTEILDLPHGTLEPGPELIQGEYKLDGAIAVLPDGRVVIPSGDGLEVYDPATNRLTSLPDTTYDARSFRTVTALGPDRVLVAGGYDDAINPTDQAVVVRIATG